MAYLHLYPFYLGIFSVNKERSRRLSRRYRSCGKAVVSELLFISWDGACKMYCQHSEHVVFTQLLFSPAIGRPCCKTVHLSLAMPCIVPNILLIGFIYITLLYESASRNRIGINEHSMAHASGQRQILTHTDKDGARCTSNLFHNIISR